MRGVATDGGRRARTGEAKTSRRNYPTLHNKTQQKGCTDGVAFLSGPWYELMRGKEYPRYYKGRGT